MLRHVKHTWYICWFFPIIFLFSPGHFLGLSPPHATPKFSPGRIPLCFPPLSYFFSTLNTQKPIVSSITGTSSKLGSPGRRRRRRCLSSALRRVCLISRARKVSAIDLPFSWKFIAVLCNFLFLTYFIFLNPSVPPCHARFVSAAAAAAILRFRTASAHFQDRPPPKLCPGRYCVPPQSNELLSSYSATIGKCSSCFDPRYSQTTPTVWRTFLSQLRNQKEKNLSSLRVLLFSRRIFATFRYLCTKFNRIDQLCGRCRFHTAVFLNICFEKLFPIAKLQTLRDVLSK